MAAGNYLLIKHTLYAWYCVKPLYIHDLIESLQITLKDGKGRLIQEVK